MKIDGKAIAEKILTDLTGEVAELKKRGVTPTLVVILVGDNPASVSYIKQKRIAAEKIGAALVLKQFPETVDARTINETIEQCNNDSSIHGIIIQRPLPKDVPPEITTTLQCVVVTKDVDGFLPNSPFEVPVAAAVLTILKEIFTISFTKLEARSSKLDDWLQQKPIVVLGRGETAGKPIADSLIKRGCKVAVVHTRTENPDEIIKRADIVISCVGKPNVVRRDNIKKDPILLSVGIRRDDEGKLHGDYDEKDIADVASFYTPTPGGVGPVNVACLMQNLVGAAKRFASLKI